MSWEYSLICDDCGALIAAGCTKIDALRQYAQLGCKGRGRHHCPACTQRRLDASTRAHSVSSEGAD